MDRTPSRPAPGAALLAVVAALLLARPAPGASQDRAEGYVDVSDGVRIHYVEMGRGTPVILIHGYTANAEGKWIRSGIADALAQRHRVVAIDVRGHGLSDKPHDPRAYGPRMAEDVVEVMDALEIDRAHVHGYSMGGSILTNILARHPERVLTAVYGGSGVAEVDPEWIARVPADPEAPEDWPQGAPPSERWSEYPGYDREALAAVRDYPWTDEERAIDLGSVGVPVLALVGEFDGPSRRTHRMARELADFELVVLPGDTHGSAHFNPLYTETLVSFLRAHDPWMGVPAPPPFTPHRLQVLDGRPPIPARAPEEEAGFTSLEGARIHRDVETLVGFAQDSRRTREVGDGSLWGRITGFPSGTRTVEWAVERLRETGITDVRLQPFDQTAGASMWLPLSWEVRLVADPDFGAGSEDVVLESAMPLSDGALPPEGVEAPLVFVGAAGPTELARVDVRGRVAVQRVVPQGHTVFTRDPVSPRAADLIERGALAVLTIVDLPGNMRVRDMGCGGGSCFNVGGGDGRFLETVLDSLALRGTPDALRVRLRIRGERYTDLSAANGVAVLPGTSRPDEYVVVNAHADAWFDGAGDNADGLAVLLALARHFGAEVERPERSVVFVASAGHHSAGLSGPAAFLAANPDIARGTVLVVNLEHTAQRHVAPARSLLPDGRRAWTTDAREAPIVAGISDGSPVLEALVVRGVARYGTNFVSTPSTMASGEGGAFRRAGLPVFTAMQGPPMYHTTGEVVEMVSVPGLERMARFAAFLVSEVAGARLADDDPRHR